MFHQSYTKHGCRRGSGHRLVWVAAVLGGAFLSEYRAEAVSLTWDPLFKPATGSDGSGIWNNGAGVWTNGSADVVWHNSTPDAATFGAGGTGSPTVALASNISAASLTFNTGPTYQINGNSITLSSNAPVTVNQAAIVGSDLYASAGVTFNVTHASGNDLITNGAIHGNFNFIKSGPGALTLNGDNTFTGNINLSAGTTIATQGVDSDLNGSLGNFNVSGRTITIASNATLLLTDSSNRYGANEFGDGAAGQVINYNGTYTPDPNLPIITINAGTLNSTRYTPLGNVNLNGATLTQASTDTAIHNTYQSYYEGYQFIGSITVTGTSPSIISATANSSDNTIGGDHLGPNTIFNVGKTSSATGTVDLTVSSPLIDQSDDFNVYNDPNYDVYLGHGAGKLTKTGPGTMSLTAANSYSGGTNVSAGTLIFSAPGAMPINTALTIGASATAVVANHGTGPKNTLFASSLTIAGTNNAWTGKLDLSNNDLDVQNGNLAILTNQLKQGYNAKGGNWNGSGGIVSSAAFSSARHLNALGIIQNSTNGSPTGTALYTTFDGNAVTSTDVLIKYTYYGDANLDGKVDASDYSRIDNGYLLHLTGWFNGDFNYDGTVDGSDYTLIDNAFNTQGATLADAIAAAQIDSASSAVPEPSYALMAMPAIVMLSRRRRPRDPATLPVAH